MKSAGQRVMLDFDLAQMYGTETAQLKRTIRRNKKRFDGEVLCLRLHVMNFQNAKLAP